MSKRANYETVTPAQAAQWLKRNISNRPLKPFYLETLIKAFRRGEWEDSADAITFDKNGNLTNGQHRLNMIVKVNQPVECLVARDLSPTAFKGIDVGLGRSNADILKISGYENCTALAQASSWLTKYINDVAPVTKGLTLSRMSGGTTRQTSEQMFKLLETHPKLIDSVKFTALFYEGVKKSPVRRVNINAGAFSFLHYLLSYDGFITITDNAEILNGEEWLCRLVTGQGVTVENNLIQTRNVLSPDALKTRRVTQVTKLAYVLKAWNACKAERVYDIIRFTSKGTNKEKFPRILAADKAFYNA